MKADEVREKELKKEYDHLYLDREDVGSAMERLDEIVKILRQECPWDREQTHESLISPMREEAYEVIEAIKNRDFENLEEELGDVALQVVFHGMLAQEAKKFDLKDILNGECDKMIRRHNHVFLGEEAKTIDKVLEKWENIKSREHCDSNITDRLRRVPLALPETTRAYKVQKKAGDVGFDFPNMEGAMEKVLEEFQELRYGIASEDTDNVFEEVGDLLFSVVNVARKLGIDPEDALSNTNKKFIDRFASMEDLATRNGQKLEDLGITAMDELWNRAKASKK